MPKAVSRAHVSAYSGRSVSSLSCSSVVSPFSRPAMQASRSSSRAAQLRRQDGEALVGHAGGEQGPGVGRKHELSSAYSGRSFRQWKRSRL